MLFEIDMDYTEQHTELPQEPQMYNYKKYAPTLCHICNKKISNVNVAKHRKYVIKNITRILLLLITTFKCNLRKCRIFLLY